MLDDPNKLIRTYFEGPDRKKIDWKDEAEHFAQRHIQRAAIDGLPAKANPLDIEVFKQGMRYFQENFDGLVDVLDDAPQPNRTGEAYMRLRGLMAAVFILGQSAVISPKAKKIWLSQLQSEKGKVGAKTNRQKAAAWQGSVIELVKAMRSKNSAMSQDDLATRLLEKWDTIDFNGKKPSKMTHSYLVKLISKKANSQANAG
jgi:hypothetical protein